VFSTVTWLVSFLFCIFPLLLLITSEEGTVRHCQSKETSILWSHHKETRELPGERNNVRNNARCTQARKTTHAWLDNIKTWTGLPVEESIRMTEINGESTSMVWPTFGSRTVKNRIALLCGCPYQCNLQTDL